MARQSAAILVLGIASIATAIAASSGPVGPMRSSAGFGFVLTVILLLTIVINLARADIDGARRDEQSRDRDRSDSE